MGLWIARLLLLLLVYQAVWACTTAVSESLLQAKPLELVGLCQVRLCVCDSSNAAKAFMHAALLRGPRCKGGSSLLLLLIVQAI